MHLKPDWTPLCAVLSQYRRSGTDLPLWWRDDDAVAPSGELQHLAKLSAKLKLPVHVAVVPDRAQSELADFMATTPQLVPIVHGWRHENHAAPDAKKSEFGTPRTTATTEITDALTRMRALFQARVLPIFVPPWNRIDASYSTALIAAGYRGLSTFTPRPARLAAPGLVQINCHIDPIDWHDTRGLKDPDTVIAETVSNLTQRLQGEADASEPFGYLTHHLVHTPDLWAFTERYLDELLSGGARPQPLAPLLETPT